MKCSKHTDRDAVAQCANCGAGVCSECAKATEDLRESCGTLCVNCYSAELQETAAFYRSRKNKKIKRVIISTILYIIGVVLLIMGSVASASSANDGSNVLYILVGILLCGIFYGITMFKKAKEEHEEHERKHGASYTITDTGVYRDTGLGTKIIYFCIGTLFGVVITPIKVIVDILDIVNYTKDAKALMAESIAVKNI